MIANTGADAKAWWWYVNLSPQAVGNAINSNNARLLDATPAGNGNFNVAMESLLRRLPRMVVVFGSGLESRSDRSAEQWRPRLHD